MEHRGIIIHVGDLNLDGGEGGERRGASIASFNDNINRWTFGVKLSSVIDEQGSWMMAAKQESDHVDIKM